MPQASTAAQASLSDIRNQPIGVLDSGLGGLSVLSALRTTLPLEDFVYCADCGNAPWGDKTSEFIIDRCRDIAHFLMTQHRIKCLVLACNTATAFAADVLRRELSIPVVGIEPAVKPAVATSAVHKVGVIATRATIDSPRYHSLLTRFGQGAEVFSVAAPGLMECVEKGDFDGVETSRLLTHYLSPLKKEGIDKLVLGCTHYPFLSRAISQLLGSEVELIEPGAAVAAVTQSRLTGLAIDRRENNAPKELFFVRKMKEHVDVLYRLWPRAVTATIKPAELRA